MIKYESPTPLAILLATYNSERYLREQLESLYSQTYMAWTLFVRDDGSSDSTMSIIADFQAKKGNIVIVFDHINCKGAKYNFMHLLEVVNAQYYMFCDHDDVWLSFKIDHSLKKMQYLESENPNIPILVHTDLIVVDDNCSIINKSMWEYAKIKPNILKRWNFCMASSFVTGNTVCINDRCKHISINMPVNALMHDWWIAIQTIKYGRIYSLKEQSVLYRLHGDNEVGISFFSKRYILNKILNYKIVVSEYNKLRPILSLINYGSFGKFLLFKVIYSIIRVF